jgi:ATP-binding cassette subfamily F protein uup
LAKLFTRPSNLLILDEPTNDLDVEILEVLEEKLAEYNGTLILVSHDRDFLDNVVTSILVFEEDGKLQEYVGGYSDWMRRGKSLAQKDSPGKTRPQTPQSDVPAKTSPPPVKSAKLTYKLQRELDSLPNLIENLEKDIAALQAETNHPDFYSRPFEQIQPVLDQLKQKQDELDRAIDRWAELEEMNS